MEVNPNPHGVLCSFNFNHAEETRYLFHCTPKSTKRDQVSVPPNSGVPHKDTVFLPSRQSSNSHLHTPSACSKPAQPPYYTTRQEFAAAQSESCPYKEVGAAAWDWGHPSLPLPTLPVRKSILGKLPNSHFYKIPGHCSLVFTIPSWGKGGIVTGEKRQKQLIKGQRRTGSFRHPPQAPHSRQWLPKWFHTPHHLKLTQCLGLRSRVEGEGGRKSEKRKWRHPKKGEGIQEVPPLGVKRMTGWSWGIGARGGVASKCDLSRGQVTYLRSGPR